MRGTWHTSATSGRSLSSAAAVLEQWTVDPTCIPGNTAANVNVRLGYMVDYTSGSGSTVTFKLYVGGTTAVVDGTLLLTETFVGPTAVTLTTWGAGTLTSIARPAASTFYKLVGSTSGASLLLRGAQLLLSPVYTS